MCHVDLCVASHGHTCLHMYINTCVCAPTPAPFHAFGDIRVCVPLSSEIHISPMPRFCSWHTPGVLRVTGLTDRDTPVCFLAFLGGVSQNPRAGLV